MTLRKWQWLLRLMGWIQIPMLAFVRPRILEMNDQRCAVRIRLSRRTKNHLKSMYFGALAVGADVVAGLPVFYLCKQRNLQFSFAFASMEANFVKRAETDVRFVCEELEKIREMIRKSHEAGERVTDHVQVNAYNDHNELVATFVMGLSVKVQS